GADVSHAAGYPSTLIDVAAAGSSVSVGDSSGSAVVFASSDGAELDGTADSSAAVAEHPVSPAMSRAGRARVRRRMAPRVPTSRRWSRVKFYLPVLSTIEQAAQEGLRAAGEALLEESNARAPENL